MDINQVRTVDKLLVDLEKYPVNVVGEPNTYGWDFEKFIEAFEKQLHFSPQESQKLAEQFIIQGRGDSMIYVNVRRFEDLINQLLHKFNDIIKMNKNQLGQILQALRQRHTGSFKWFMQNSLPSSQGSIDETGWNRSIDSLGLRWQPREKS